MSNRRQIPFEVGQMGKVWVASISLMGISAIGATEAAFERAVAEVTATTTRLLAELPPRKQPPSTEPPLRRLARP